MKKLGLAIQGVFLIFVLSCGVQPSLKHTPDLTAYTVEKPNVIRFNDSTFQFKNNYLTKNTYQLWELSTQGNALQLGYNYGALMQPLMKEQEDVFFSKVKEFVPSPTKQWLLRNFLKWYNRKMYLHVNNEQQSEIFGISQYSSGEYDFVAPGFLRNMYLHGAHDIGHAMQDLMMVGCSSVAVWDEASVDGSLLIGRNFDFYVGEDFAKNKVVQIVEPENGYKYVSVSWPGMIGVVSGMNVEGLTVTINAGKSKIPLVAKTPISLVTREILQYAKSIDEAIAIAKTKKVFVSESIMVGSAHDRKAVLIEMSPKKFGVYKVDNSSKLVCTNHFQSEAFKDDKRNAKHIAESHSQYRYEKIHEILKQEKRLDVESMALLLRNRSGLQNKEIGLGNEKALNQLLAHHAVIFAPEQKKMWVSANPYQLGNFVCYNLNTVFGQSFGVKADESCTLPVDPFLHSETFTKYREYLRLSDELQNSIDASTELSDDWLQTFENTNPNFWKTYFLIGKYYYQRKEFSKALIYFQQALQKEVTTLPDIKMLEKYVLKSKKKLS